LVDLFADDTAKKPSLEYETKHVLRFLSSLPGD